VFNDNTLKSHADGNTVWSSKTHFAGPS